MAKKNATPDGSGNGQGLPFEVALSELERVVTELENGRLSLTDSLASYEKGVFYLRHCYEMLENAEKKIAILSGTDDTGQPVVRPWEDDGEASLEDKARARARRRSADSASRNDWPTNFRDDGSVDVSDGLF